MALTLQSVLAGGRYPILHGHGYRELDFARSAVAQNSAAGGLDVTLEVWLQTKSMAAPQRLMQSNFRDAYWTVAGPDLPAGTSVRIIDADAMTLIVEQVE